MEQIVSNNSSLSIVTCPSCHRAITVYMDTGPDTEMRCPLCQTTFPFQNVLSGLPPMLQIASDVELSPAKADDEESKKFSFDELPVPPTPKKRSRSKSKSGSSANSKVRAQAKRNKSDRKRKAAFKQAGTLRETVLFILGGLMALPVGQLIIWWVIGKDPLNLGPSVSNVAAFVVPEKFQGKPDEDESAAGQDDDSAGPENNSKKAKQKLATPDTNAADIRKLLKEKDKQ